MAVVSTGTVPVCCVMKYKCLCVWPLSVTQCNVHWLYVLLHVDFCFSFLLNKCNYYIYICNCLCLWCEYKYWHLKRDVRKNILDMSPSEDSDQPAHSHSLMRIFTERILDNQGCKVSSSSWSPRRLIRLHVCARWFESSLGTCQNAEGTFSHVAVHFIVTAFGNVRCIRGCHEMLYQYF